MINLKKRLISNYKNVAITSDNVKAIPLEE